MLWGCTKSQPSVLNGTFENSLTTILNHYFAQITSNKTKGLGFDGQCQFGTQCSFVGVERDVQAGNARISSGEVLVICWANGDAGHGLETFLTGRESWTWCPEINLLPQHREETPWMVHAVMFLLHKCFESHSWKTRQKENKTIKGKKNLGKEKAKGNWKARRIKC